jgi:hypothetical protein
LSQELPAYGDDTNSENPAYQANFSKVRAMASREYFEQTATSLGTLDREELKRQIKNFRGRFKLDFTEDYLNSASVDRLRHILFAALINAEPRD